MTPKQRELARHALGMGRSKRSYRNHFVTSLDTEDFMEWMKMAKEGYAVGRTSVMLPVGGMSFNLTQEGAEKALNDDEELCPEDFPKWKEKA